MDRLRALLIVGALLLAVPVEAQPHFLDPGKFDVATVLPPPPADGSVRQKDELAELDRIVGERSPEELARAISDDANETPSIFHDAIGSSFDLKALPATAKLLDDTMAEGRYFENDAKKRFMRNRP